MGGARSIIVRRAEGFEEADDVFYYENEEDDVAQFHQEDFTAEEVTEEVAGNCEIRENAEDVRHSMNFERCTIS